MPRKQKRHHYIYRTTNTITNKFYIGMHSTNNLDDGYVGSGKRLWYSINKYGRENHIREIMEFLPNRTELKKRESNIVNKELLEEPLCMNLICGGSGGFDHLNTGSEEHKERCRRGAAAKHTKVGKKELTEQLKKAWQKLREKYNEEEWKVICKNNLKSFDWTGKQHSEKTKEKMRKSAKGKQVGEKNSQYGTCWIYNIRLQQNKKIKKIELEKWLRAGWLKGRKFLTKD